jgi:hypothetical protein
MTCADSGHLGLCATGSEYCFSWWSSPEIDIQDDTIYKARWQVASDAALPDDAVQFRLRANQHGSWQAWNRIVASNNQNAPFLGYPQWYALLMDPDVTGESDDTILLSMDIMSFDWQDDASSWLYLEEVLVETVDVNIVSQIYARDLSSDPGGWIYAGTIPPYDEPNTSSFPPALNPHNSLNCFSFWYSPDITVEDIKIYRARFNVGSSVTDPDDAVQFRLRVNQKGSWQAWDRVVVSNMGQAPSADAAKTYSVLFDPRVSGSSDNVASLAFDIMSFDITDDVDSWLYLESVQVHEVNVAP